MILVIFRAIPLKDGGITGDDTTTPARPRYWFLSIAVAAMDTGIMFSKGRFSN